jgi:hypothetical protein
VVLAARALQITDRAVATLGKQKRVHIFNRTGEVFQNDHAATRSVSVGSSLGASELFTRRDTVHVCSDL